MKTERTMPETPLRILVLSFYYPPDLSAGSFRVNALISTLRERLPPGSHIDVISTLPNRYSSFSASAPEEERSEGLSVKRVKLPGHRSGVLDQSRAFVSYWRAVVRHVANEEYHLVLGTSSRLMTAVLAARVAFMKKTALYLDIRDIFVDTIGDVFPRILAWPATLFFSLLEKWSIGRADKVNLISAGFTGYFRERYPRQRFSFFTNGIDAEFLNLPTLPSRKTIPGAMLTVLYAGNIGEGQGLHHILPRLARRTQGRVVFKVVGDGGRRTALMDAVAAEGVDNVIFLPPVGRDELIGYYQEADILFLHLNDLEAFKKVLPSKLFEYAATGKPIWAGVSGYAAEFIRQEMRNAQVFPPCDDAMAMQMFECLDMAWTDRRTFIEKFSRLTIMKAMAEDVHSVASTYQRPS